MENVKGDARFMHLITLVEEARKAMCIMHESKSKFCK